MDTQDQSKATTPSGHESHGVHLCHRCGWPFPNPHPSAKHRRAHKKICGTMEGYTNLINSGVVSDDEHHSDEDKEKTPSPKTEKQKSIKESGGGDGIGGRSSRSEDDLFADAVTEFSDSGTSPGTNEVSNSPIEISKSDASLKVIETLDTFMGKIGETETDGKPSDGLVKDGVESTPGQNEITTVCDSTEAKLELPETDGKPSDGLVKDGVVESTPEQSDVSQSHEAEATDVVEAEEDKVQETRTSEVDERVVPTTIIEEVRDAESRASETSKTSRESVNGLKEADFSVTIGVPGEDDDGEQEKLDKLSNVAISEKLEAAMEEGVGEELKHEKLESDHEKVSEVVKESVIDQSAEGINEEIRHAKFESDHEHAPEVVKGSEIDQMEGISEEIKQDKFESDHEHAPEVVKEPETDQSVSVLTEKGDLDAPELETCSKEHTQEVKRPDSVLTEKADLGAPNLEKGSKEHTQVVEEPDSVLTEKADLGATNLERGSKEHTQEAVEEPDSVLTEKTDLGAPTLEKGSKEHTQEAVEALDSVLTEKAYLGAPSLEKGSKEHTQEAVEEPDSVSTEKADLGAPHLEKGSKEHTQEVVKELDSVLTEKADLGAPSSEKGSKEHTPEAVEEPDSVLTEKADVAVNLDKGSKEHTQEVVEEPGSVLTGKADLGAPPEKGSKEHTHEVEEPGSVLTDKADLGAPNLEKGSKEHAQEVVEEPDSVSTEKADLGAPNSEKHSKEHAQEVVKESDSVLTEKEDLGAPNLEECSKEHTQEVVKEPKIDGDSNVVAAGVSAEKITLKEAEQSSNDLERASDNSIAINDTQNGKNASGVVSEPIVEEGNGKLMNNPDSGVDLSVDSSSVNSLEGNWGSVSVLSTASVDVETSHTVGKSKVDSGKSVAVDSRSGTSDVFEPPSFMTLVEPKAEVVDRKAASSEAQDSQQQAKSKASKAGWFPTLTNVSNESEGRKRNEEAITKVTNWSTGKHSTPLKNLLGEAKSPNSKPPATVVQTDEAATEKSSLLVEAPAVNQDSSPPKLIDDGEKVRKKVKGRVSWMPFVCCSSVNVVN